MNVYVATCPRGADAMENLSPQQRAQLEMNQVGLGRAPREGGSRSCSNGLARRDLGRATMSIQWYSV